MELIDKQYQADKAKLQKIRLLLVSEAGNHLVHLH